MLVVLTTSRIMMGPHHAATVESLLTTRVGQTISWSTYHESRDKFFRPEFNCKLANLLGLTDKTRYWRRFSRIFYEHLASLYKQRLDELPITDSDRLATSNVAGSAGHDQAHGVQFCSAWKSYQLPSLVCCQCNH